MLHHFIVQCLKNMLLHSIETVIYQYLQLILQCYFNGHAVAPLVVAGAFLITQKNPMENLTCAHFPSVG